MAEILNNKLSAQDRQESLMHYYTEQTDEPPIIAPRIFHITSTKRIDEILEKFQNQIDNVKNEINEKTSNEIRELIREYHDLFILPDDPLPAVTGIEHEIELTTDKAISTPISKHPSCMRQEIETQIEKFKNQGLLRDPHSTYQSNVWLVSRKMDNSNKKDTALFWISVR